MIDLRIRSTLHLTNYFGLNYYFRDSIYSDQDVVVDDDAAAAVDIKPVVDRIVDADKHWLFK